MKEIKDSDVKPSPPKKPLFFYYLVALIVLMLLNVFLFPSMLERQVYEVPYSQFLDMVDDGRVTQVALDETNREIVFLATDESGSEAVYQTGIWPDDGQRPGPTTDSGCSVSCGKTRTSSLPLKSPPRPTPSSLSW